MPEPPASTSEQHHAGAELDPDAEVYAKPEESAGGSSEAFMKRTNMAAAVFEAEVGRQIEARTRLGHERYQDKVRGLLDAAVSPAHRVFRAKDGAQRALAQPHPSYACVQVWFCLGRESQPRKFCINVNNDSRFHTAVVVLILISSVYMVVSQRLDNPRMLPCPSRLSP